MIMWHIGYVIHTSFITLEDLYLDFMILFYVMYMGPVIPHFVSHMWSTIFNITYIFHMQPQHLTHSFDVHSMMMSLFKCYSSTCMVDDVIYN
jgi:hypothetical protein